MNIFKGVLQWSINKRWSMQRNFYSCYTMNMCSLGKIKKCRWRKRKKEMKYFYILQELNTLEEKSNCWHLEVYALKICVLWTRWWVKSFLFSHNGEWGQLRPLRLAFLLQPCWKEPVQHLCNVTLSSPTVHIKAWGKARGSFFLSYMERRRLFSPL